jgi:hypothetical protein
MANGIEIVLAADCITQIEVGAQQSPLAVDRPPPPSTSANGEAIALSPRMGFTASPSKVQRFFAKHYLDWTP